MNTPTREITMARKYLPPFSKGVTLKGKDLLPRSKSFPLRVAPIEKGFWHKNVHKYWLTACRSKPAKGKCG